MLTGSGAMSQYPRRYSAD